MKTKLFNYLITLTLVGLAAWAAASLYYRYLENPWTRDGQVRANVVGIAPRVSGPIIRVAVRDNESVHQGDLLFEIDPADFQAQVDLAAGQVQTAEANLKQLSQNLQRQTQLYGRASTPCKIFRTPRTALRRPGPSWPRPKPISNWPD